jgi:hypothetical protein
MLKPDPWKKDSGSGEGPLIQKFWNGVFLSTTDCNVGICTPALPHPPILHATKPYEKPILIKIRSLWQLYVADGWTVPLSYIHFFANTNMTNSHSLSRVAWGDHLVWPPDRWNNCFEGHPLYTLVTTRITVTWLIRNFRDSVTLQQYKSIESAAFVE